MNRLLIALAALAGLMVQPSVSVAQDRGTVVAACSTRSYSAAENRPFTLTTTGDMCVSGASGGGGATGPGTAATAQRVTYASDGSTIPTLDQNISQSAFPATKQTNTRPADTTAYTGLTSATQGDLIANSTTAGSVTPLTFTIPAISGTGTAEGYITGVTVRSSTRRAQFTIRVHIFQTTAPTVSSGDNAAITVTNYSAATYVCFVDVVMDPGPAGNHGIADDTLCPYSKTSAASVYALMEAYSGFTPASGETFDVGLLPTRTR